MKRRMIRVVSLMTFAIPAATAISFAGRQVVPGAGDAPGQTTETPAARSDRNNADASARREPDHAEPAAATAPPQEVAGGGARGPAPIGTSRPGRPQRVPFIPRPGFGGSYTMGPNGVAYPAVPQPQQPAPEDVGQVASCVLQIDAEPAYNPSTGATVALDAATAAGLLQSSAVLDTSAKKAFGAKARNWRDWVYVSAAPTSPRFLRVDVMIMKDRPAEWGGAEDDVASKLMKAMTQSLRNALQESAEAQRQHFDKRRAALEKDLEVARQRLKAVRDKARKYRDETGLLAQQYGGDARNALVNLRNQQQQYESQLLNYRSRLKAIQPTTSPLVAEWASIVELRQKRLEELKADPNAGRDNVASAERNLAEARTQLDAYRRAAASEADQSRNRNGEALSLQSNINDTEARLKPVLDQIAKLQDEKVAAMIEELPELQNEENRVRSEVNELTNRLDQFRRTSNVAGEISLRVLDGEPDE